MSDYDDLVADLDGHLEATATLPIEREANRWIGEAHAVVADLRHEDLPPAVVESRIEAVRRLLSNVDATGNETADEHVAAARSIAERIVRPNEDGAPDGP